jgi:hypothetical protein
VPKIKVHHIDFYAADWLEGTISLTHIERSVYITICAAIWAHGGPVEVKHVLRLCPGNGFKKALAALIAKEKVLQDNNEVALLSQSRAMTELRVAADRLESAWQNGAKGGRPINDLAKPPGFFKNNLQRKPNNNKNKKKNLPSVGEVSARAPLPAVGAGAPRDDTTWKRVGNGLHLDASPEANGHDRRVQQHIEFLKTHGANADLDLYLAAQMGDDPDAAQRMFDLTEARMAG